MGILDALCETDALSGRVAGRQGKVASVRRGRLAMEGKRSAKDLSVSVRVLVLASKILGQGELAAELVRRERKERLFERVRSLDPG